MAPDNPEPLIVTVIHNYHPDWEPPADRGTEWIPCLCPFHGDSRPSASVSFGNDAFKCFVCDASGDAIGIIMREEGIRYPEAIEYAEGLQPGSSAAVRRQPARKSGRRVFGQETTTEAPSSGLRPGIRDRRTPWS